jgi:hypothetical protein
MLFVDQPIGTGFSVAGEGLWCAMLDILGYAGLVAVLPAMVQAYAYPCLYLGLTHRLSCEAIHQASS